MTAARVAAGRLAGAATAALLAALLIPAAVAAAGGTRLAVRDAVLAEVGRPVVGPAADAAMVADAWRAAGAGPRAAVDAAMALPPHRRAPELVRRLCGPAPRPSAAHPAAADLVLYVDGSRPTAGQARVGIFLDAAEVAVIDPVAGLVRSVESQLVVGDPASGTAPVYAMRDAASLVCSIDSSIVAGAGDVEAFGHIALVDPATAAGRLGYAADHPRDGDTSAVHTLTSAVDRGLRLFVTSALGGIAGVLGQAASLAGAVGATAARALEWTHDRLGWRLALLPALFVTWAGRRLLGASLDLRGVHAVLVTALGIALGAAGIPLLAAWAAVAGTGRLTGWWTPAEGSALWRVAVWNVATFLVDNLTGLDGSRPTSLLAIAVALGGDAILYAKPLLAARLAARLAPLAARLAAGRPAVAGLRHVASVADVVGGKPTAVSGLVGRSAPAAGAMTGARLGRQALAHGVEAACLPLRSPAAPGNDIASLLSHGAGYLAAHASQLGESPSLVLRGVGAGLGRIDAASRDRLLRAAFPALRDLGDLAHLHSGALTVTGLAGGTAPTAMHAPPPPTPPVRDPRLGALIGRMRGD